MSKILENKQIIHIAAELVVLLGITFFFSQKNKKIMNHINDLSQRIEEQEDIIQKYEQLIKNLTKKVEEHDQKLLFIQNMNSKMSNINTHLQTQESYVQQKPQVQPQVQPQPRPVQKKNQTKKLKNNSNTKKVSKQNTNLENTDLENTELENSELENSELENTELENTNLEKLKFFENNKLSKENNNDVDILRRTNNVEKKVPFHTIIVGNIQMSHNSHKSQNDNRVEEIIDDIEEETDEEEDEEVDEEVDEELLDAELEEELKDLN